MKIPYERTCPCATALQNAIITHAERIPMDIRKDLYPIIGKYLPYGEDC
jgi:5'-methylthioadenosine phosphorylase